MLQQKTVNESISVELVKMALKPSASRVVPVSSVKL